MLEHKMEINGIRVYLIFDSGYMESLWLPEPAEGKYYLDKQGRDTKNQVYIEARNNQWYLCCNTLNRILDSSGISTNNIILLDRCKFYVKFAEEVCVLYAENVNHSSAIFHNYQICDNCKISIGRSADNDLIYLNELVSGHHALLEKTKEGIVVRDTDSLNGIFVNGRQVKEELLNIGDLVFIMGLKIIIGINFISINDGNERIKIKSKKIYPYIPKEYNDNTDVYEMRDTDHLFNRSPRRKRKFEANPITIEPPPFSLSSSQVPLILRMGGSMVMGGSALARGNYTSVLSMLLFPLMNHLYTDKDKKEYEKLRCKKYSEYLENKRGEIRKEKIIEETILNEKYPPLSTIINYPVEKKLLWERENRDDDFLKLRVGHGQLPLMATLKYPEKKFELEEDPLEKEMYLLAEQKVLLDRVPIMLSLTEDFICGVMGKKKEKAEVLIRILIQTVFLHSYDEVKIVLLLDDEILEKIPQIRFLPHIWNDERNFRFLASDLSSGYLVGEYLNNELGKEIEKPRDLKEILKDRPYYVVFAWNKRIFDGMEILKVAAKGEKNPGLSIITFFDEVPQNVHNIIQLHSDGPNEIVRLKKMENYSDEFFLDEVNYKLTYKMMRVIANTKIKTIQGTYTLPKMITFLELFGVGKVEHLNPLKRWKENNPVKSLAVQVGIAADGTPFMLDLHEKYQGPHGLIAGMTGSGKSEFIITLILSLALNFHPEEVAFVLIDYKGGGLTGAFEDEERGIHLPHLAGTITNLDGSSIQRALMSIESELKRRQRIFNEAKSATNEGTMDIYTYQKLYRSGKVEIPLPHLFIISDEFAELKSQEPEFMDQLISTARIGRSLGVHLILATQKPSGVVNDQISSNAKFRVCLKVQTRADSDEMLRRPEAAELKDTGRFYLQVGYNEYFALGQSAWCGAPYEPQEEKIEPKDDYVQFIDDAGQNIVQVRPAIEKKNSGMSQLVAIVRYLSELSRKAHIDQGRLWLEPLPTEISIQRLLKQQSYSGKGSVTATIGMIDDPENQKQYPLVFDFLKCKNFLVVGGNQSGKSTLLQTMLYALINSYSPNDINYYILDYSSGLLNVFGHTSHCGGIWGEGDEQQVEKFFELLNEIIADRKADFLAAEVNSFEAYREIDQMPLILVVIDNITGLYSWKGGQNIYYDLNLLIREANSVGIKFLISAGSIDDVLYKVKKEFGTRFVLSAKNRFEYGDILGVNCRFEPPQLSGRGLWREGDRPLECQIARYNFKGTQQQEIQKLREEIKQIARKYCDGKYAREIPQISESETYEEFCSDILPNRIPLGYSVTDIRKISVPLKQLYCMASYFGNTRGVEKILCNYLYGALRSEMHLFIMKRSQNSIFDTETLRETLQNNSNITCFHSTKEDCTKLWKTMYELICERKIIRDEYCDAHNIARNSSETMQLCFSYMQLKTYPVLVIFESFRDFCSNADKDTKAFMEKVFCDGRGYNYYFLGCYYPDDASSLSMNDLHMAFNREGFTILYGGQFHRQGLLNLPMEYRSLTKPSKKYGSCVMQYHGELYSLWMPCGDAKEQNVDPDDADIIS